MRFSMLDRSTILNPTQNMSKDVTPLAVRKLVYWEGSVLGRLALAIAQCNGMDWQVKVKVRVSNYLSLFGMGDCYDGWQAGLETLDVRH